MIHGYYKIKATASGIKDPRPGAISFTQLAGSALNLTSHLHILFCEGVFAGFSQICPVNLGNLSQIVFC